MNLPKRHVCPEMSGNFVATFPLVKWTGPRSYWTFIAWGIDPLMEERIGLPLRARCPWCDLQLGAREALADGCPRGCHDEERLS